MDAIQEQPLTQNIKDEFAFVSKQGLELLGFVDPNIPPEQIVATIDAYVDKWQAAVRNNVPLTLPKGMDAADVALGLGAVWGNQLVRRFGWEWTCITSEGKKRFVVASPKRAIMIAPTYFIKACLANPNADCTVMLAFNILTKDKLPVLPDHGYRDVMLGVKRIVPKR